MYTIVLLHITCDAILECKYIAVNDLIDLGWHGTYLGIIISDLCGITDIMLRVCVKSDLIQKSLNTGLINDF